MQVLNRTVLRPENEDTKGKESNCKLYNITLNVLTTFEGADLGSKVEQCVLDVGGVSHGLRQ